VTTGQLERERERERERKQYDVTVFQTIIIFFPWFQCIIIGAKIHFRIPSEWEEHIRQQCCDFKCQL
jgi:hypothetical protein